MMRQGPMGLVLAQFLPLFNSALLRMESERLLTVPSRQTILANIVQ